MVARLPQSTLTTRVENTPWRDTTTAHRSRLQLETSHQGHVGLLSLEFSSTPGI